MDILSFLLGRITADGSGGGGSEAVLIDKAISANGVYNASDDNADGYKKVTAQVPNSYDAADEGKVVSSGALVSQTAHADVTPTTSDQMIDTTLNNSIKVIGDADLVSGNIKKDVQIFGVTGTYEGDGGGGISVDDFVNRLLTGDIVITPTVSNSNDRIFYNMTGITGCTVQCAQGFAFGENAFSGCSNLLYLKCFPYSNYNGGFVSPGNFALNCTKLKHVVGLRKVTGGTAFHNCNKLEAVDMFCRQSGDGFNSNTTFNACASLTTLVIRGSVVANLSNINNFQNTPFESGKHGGTLYVPNSLISDYQSASNWSTILGYTNNHIQAIEGSYYETHYVDGTVIS